MPSYPFSFQAVFTYWLTSNVYSVGQIMALKHPAVRAWLNLPEAEKAVVKQKPSGSFFQNFKAGKCLLQIYNW